jgi:hypothetical protein
VDQFNAPRGATSDLRLLRCRVATKLFEPGVNVCLRLSVDLTGSRPAPQRGTAILSIPEVLIEASSPSVSCSTEMPLSAIGIDTIALAPIFMDRRRRDR